MDNFNDYEWADRDFISGLIGEGPLSSWWNQRQLICRMERLEECTDISIDGQEIIWAAVVYYQAFDLADWMVSKGYVATEVHKWADGEDRVLCVPYDASNWDEWIQSKLMIPQPRSTDDDRRKETIREMVRRKYIKIPMNSGLSLYHWLLKGYRRGDFCEIYGCIEYLGNCYQEHARFWSIEQIETCLESYMDESVRAGTAIWMVQAAYEWSSFDAEGYGDKVLARLLENMYLKYRGRRLFASATKIQCVFRVYRSRKRANVLRSHPDNLFSEFWAPRKRILEIDDTRFGS